MSCLVKKKVYLVALCLVLVFSLASCSSAPAPEETTATPTAFSTVTPTAEPENPATALSLSWPKDEAIAYCPVFEGTPTSVNKQEGNQAKAYALKYEGITVDQYLDYVELFEQDKNIVIDSNTNLRDNAYSLNAHKLDDPYMIIRLVYTRYTESLALTITYAHPEVMPE